MPNNQHGKPENFDDDGDQISCKNNIHLGVKNPRNNENILVQRTETKDGKDQSKLTAKYLSLANLFRTSET